MSKLRGQAALRPDFPTEITNCCEKKIGDFSGLENHIHSKTLRYLDK